MKSKATTREQAVQFIKSGDHWLPENGIEVVALDNPECRQLLDGFIAAHREVWNEDIGE